MHSYEDSSTFRPTSGICLFCFDQRTVDTAFPNNASKLFDNCCKYLHSAIISGTNTENDLSFEKRKLSFCEKCLQSAVELSGLSEQLEYCQRSISELIFMFSLRILHRRKKYSSSVNRITRKIEQVDISGLPELDNDFDLATAIECPFQESTDCQQQLVLAPHIENNTLEIEDPVDFFDSDDITVTEVKIENCINDEELIENSFKVEDITVSTSTCLQTPTVEKSKNVSKEEIAKSLFPVVRLERLTLENILSHNKLSKGIKIGNVKSRHSQNPLSIESKARDSPKIFKNPLITPIKMEPFSLSVAEISDFVREEVENVENRKRYDSDVQDEAYDPKYGIHENRFKCKVCKKRFRFKCILVNHEKTHTGDKPFSCDVCSKAFKNKHTLSNHSRIHTGEKPYECEICHKQFTFQSGLFTHKFQHTGEKRFQCSHCKKRFTHKNTLLTHYKVHTEDKKRKRELKKKVNINSNDEPHSCEICGKVLANKQSLYIHRYNHTKPNKCPMCGKRFALKEELNSHMTLHDGEKWQCTVCDKMFASKVTLAIHESIHTGEKSYQCAICFKSFRQSSSLYAHRNVHNKPHKCQICNRRFALKNSLESHMLKHTGSTGKVKSSMKPKSKIKKPSDTEKVKCGVCDKEFKTKQTLLIHSSIHTGEKAFQCDVCFKTFRQSSSLYTHMKVHTKPNKCPICNKRFALKTALANHISRHKGEKRHKCDLCPYAAVNPNTLKIHVLRRHTENKCRCRDCGKVFTTAEQLKGHYKRVHFAIDYTDDCAVPIS